MPKYFRPCLVGFTAAFFTFSALAQVSGVITDSRSGKPVNGVEVFLSQTTTGTLSDDAGQFALENPPVGFHEIVLYKKGFSLFRSSMKILSGHAYDMKLSLTPSKKQKSTPLTEEEKATLKTKLTHRGGGNPMAAILNEKDIMINIVEGQRLLATNSPLIVQNGATGFRFKYYGMGKSLQDISGAPLRCEQLPAADINQNITWEKNRKEYFQGSQRHWLTTMVAGQTKEQGYDLKDEKGNEVNVPGLLSTSSLPGYSKLTISQPLIVHYKKIDGSVETSHVVTDGAIDINGAGFLINAKALSTEGAMSNVGLAEQLPMDYQPIAGDVEYAYAQTLERFHEKVYVHTDKPYYYPGEFMWIKGYINYREPAWRDSLSKVMYVELIDPKKELALSKTLKIDSGFFHNDFKLPDTLKSGTYYLRAYTKLARNFGDSSLFVKPIVILSINDKVEYSGGNTEETENFLLTIASDKKKYKAREKIILILNTIGKDGKPMAANLSVAVTDATQVAPIDEPITISNSFPFSAEKTGKVIELKYPVERGVTLVGQFLNDNGKPEKTNLTILQRKPRNLMMAASDGGGIFSITGLNFYDTSAFSFKSDKANASPYGKVALLPRDVANTNFKVVNFSLPIRDAQSPQRAVSDYDVSAGKLLKTVEARATRIPDEFQNDYRTKRSYGAPDYILKARDINMAYGNLVYALVGKVPGLVVQPEASSIKFSRSATQSITSGSGPMVTINDVPMGGEAYDIISNINPSSVESIEFTKRLNVLYGSQGANGVISVYTKQGLTDETLKVASNFQTLKIAGYALPRKFKSPNYDDRETEIAKSDYRSTIYWNPEVMISAKTGTAAVSFFAADLPGKYRIVAEGVTQNGEPVRCVYFVAIDKGF